MLETEGMLFRVLRGVFFESCVGIIDDSLRGISTAVLDNRCVGLENKSAARIFFCGGCVGDEDEEGPLDSFRFKFLLEGITSLTEDPGVGER